MESAVSDIELPASGTILAGKYEIVRIIGQGGMGVVFEAHHLGLNQRVAIKMLRPTVLHLDAITPRFDREARTAAHLKGRHVARIFDVDVTEAGLPFMVMEYLVGRDLEAEIQERGTLSVVEATGYVLQACVAMREAHSAGIVHRDLKPANLFLTEEGGEVIVKVLDFGISKITHEVDSKLTGTFATVGTPLYMSPEQVRSSKDVDHRTDIWSLAVILFEALAGQPPFCGSMTATAAAIVADPTPSLCALRPDVPPELDAVLERALSKSPGKRYTDVDALIVALAPFGPEKLPFSSAGESSGPLLPPSGPISLRFMPLAPVSRPSVTSNVAETMLLPRAEQARARATTTRRRLQVGGLAVLGAALVGTIAMMLGASSQPPAARVGAGASRPGSATPATADPFPTASAPSSAVSSAAAPDASTATSATSSVPPQSVPVRPPPSPSYAHSVSPPHPPATSATSVRPSTHSPSPAPSTNPTFL